MFLAPIQHEAHGRPRVARQVDGEHAVIADAVLGAEAAAGELADHTNLVGRKVEYSAASSRTLSVNWVEA